MSINLPSNIRPVVTKHIDDRYEVATFADINSNGPLYEGMLRYVLDMDKIFKRQSDGSWKLFGETDNNSLWLVYAVDGNGEGASYDKMADATHYGIMEGSVKPTVIEPSVWIPLSVQPSESIERAWVAYVMNTDGAMFTFTPQDGIPYTHYGVVFSKDQPVVSDYIGRWIPYNRDASSAYKAYATDDIGTGATYVKAVGVTYTHYAIVTGLVRPSVQSIPQTEWTAYIPDGTGATGKSAYQSWLDQGNTGSEADFIAYLEGDPADGVWIVYAEDGEGLNASYDRLPIHTHYTFVSGPTKPLASMGEGWMTLVDQLIKTWEFYADDESGTNPTQVYAGQEWRTIINSKLIPTDFTGVQWVPIGGGLDSGYFE